MQLLLTKEKTWNVIEESAPSPFTDEWRNKDASAYATIGLNFEDDQANIIRSMKTAREAWDALKSYHEKGSANSKVRLLKNIMSMRLEEGGDVELHIAKINDAFHPMIEVGKTVNIKKVATLLGSLPESYDTLVTSLESRAESELTANVIQSRLFDEYQRRQYKNGAQGGDSALKVTGTVHKDKSCFFCNKNGHFKKDCHQNHNWLAKQDKFG